MNTPTKYDKIGSGYNTTRKADPYLLSRIVQLLNLNPNSTLLDVGAGTGNYTIELQKHGFQLTGVEPSEAMRMVAQQRNSEVRWLAGTAETFDLDETFDGAIATLTTHHWNDLELGFEAIKKHLKDGAPLVIFTSTPKQMSTYWLNEYFPKMISDSAVQMPTEELTIHALKEAGFSRIETEKYFVKPDLQDQFLQCGKEQPELYFREDIRNGISSFRSFGYKDEVEDGLSKLREDIDSGRWKEVAQQYESSEGDYLFIKAL